MVLDQLLDALDRQAVFVEKIADTDQKIHIFGPVIAPASGAFHRTHRSKFGLPEAQDMLGNAKLFGNFTDRSERLLGLFQGETPFTQKDKPDRTRVRVY